MSSENRIAGIVKDGSFVSSSTKKGALLTTCTYARSSYPRKWQNRFNTI